jgi:hypothetical protein
MEKKLEKKPKPLSRLKNSAKGEIHHVEIHPAKNSRGGRAFLTKTFRKPTASAQAQADKAGKYMPESSLDNETVHEDGADMLAHVGNTYGVKPPADDGDGDEDTEDQDEQAA